MKGLVCLQVCPVRPDSAKLLRSLQLFRKFSKWLFTWRAKAEALWANPGGQLRLFLTLIHMFCLIYKPLLSN